jgi:hypothetical protein
MVRSDSSQEVRNLLLLRATVAALGERMTPPWWRTQFLTEVGLRTTVRVFPRTAVSAAIQSVVAAARADHDKRIGTGKRYHLFRLPASIEQAITPAMQEEDFGSEIAELIKGGRDAIISRLEALAGNRAVPAAEGPVGLGPPSRIAQERALQEMAAHYLAGLAYGNRRFPYFEEPERRP